MFIENNIHQNTVLNGILEHIKKIRAYTIYGRMYVLPVKYIRKNPRYYDQLQINTDTHFNAIIMDIDNEDLLAEWNDVGLPVPTIQTLNADNNKAHLIWLLNHPVSKTNKKAVAYYRDIVKSIQILIGADQNYQNHQTKNFFNDEAYRVIYNDEAYDLAEFHDFVINHQQSASDAAVNAAEASTSRHITLFNQLRHYGYTIAKNKNLHALLENKANQINQQFEVPIKPRSIVKSVYEFCHANRNNFRSKSREKPMGFSQIKNLSREEFLQEVSLRQSLAAKRTTQMKIADTLRSIMAAVKFMQRTGSKITLQAIANSSKKSLSTVKRYGKWIKKFIQKEAGLIRSIRVLASGGEGRAVSSIPLRGNYQLNRIVQYGENYSRKTHSSQNAEGGNLYVIEH